jgi:hypothetical protein
MSLTLPLGTQLALRASSATPTGIEGKDEKAILRDDLPAIVKTLAESVSGTARSSKGLAGGSPDLAGRNPEPLTVEVLRRKLDAAIDAEEWKAVAVIRERIVQAERDAAGNVLPFNATRRRGR